MTSATIELDSTQVQAALGELSKNLGAMAPVMRRIANTFAAGIEEAFRKEQNPVTGTPWQRLSAVTIARREAAGHWPGKKLQVSGRLVSSIVQGWGSDHAEAGTNVEYATTMQFGANKGEFGRTKRGGPIPWGDIPARPFVGFSPEIESDILDLVQNALRE